MRRLLLALTLLLVAAAPAAQAQGPGDATVVAVIDSGFNPYHHDFSAAHVPGSIADLPLDQPPSAWLDGAPATTDLPLTLDADDPARPVSELAVQDTAKLAAMQPGTLYRVPGTKIIGAARFGSGAFYGGTSAHGFGTSSSAVGNLHGTCPECLVVLLKYTDAASAEQAIDWAMDQPWIDAISNSYGFSLASRDRLYSKSSVAKQRTASERGQTIFFSAGNGQENAFAVPNTTDFSSQEGPDWIVTVSAVTPGADNRYRNANPAHAPYTGTGKPADVAGIGSSYPTGYTSSTVGGTGGTGFSGTSNATPQVAGLYARALAQARRDLGGPSRTQAAGVVATGSAPACGAARPGCELGDGVLTATELRTRLLEGGRQTTQGLAPAGLAAAPKVTELDFASVGHGFYAGRESRDRDAWLGELESRLTGPLAGRVAAPARPSGEREWMLVDSFCRQENWGAWSGGSFLAGRDTLPGPDAASPLRSGRAATCPGGPTPIN